MCGIHEKLPDEICGETCGFHDPKLTLDFRSNRIYSRGDFNLGIVCTLPPTRAQLKTGYKNRGYRLRSCSSSRGLSSRGGLRSINKPTTAKEFFVRQSNMYHLGPGELGPFYSCFSVHENILIVPLILDWLHVHGGMVKLVLLILMSAG